jgi:hypothetical protein
MSCEDHIHGGDQVVECGGTGVFDHDAALDGGEITQGKAVSPLLRRSATALHKKRSFARLPDGEARRFFQEFPNGIGVRAVADSKCRNPR